TVSNYFLLSLAVADLILGTISMNLYTTYILIGRWTLGSLACDVWLAVDYVASNASVMNLLAISFDRYLSVTRPLTYRVSRTTRRAALLIGLAWGISFLLWAPAILFWQHIVGERTVHEDQCSVQFLSEPVITFGTAIAAFYLPVSVMVGLYWRVYRETERRSRQLAGLIASHRDDSNKSSQCGGHSGLVVSTFASHLQVWGFDSCFHHVCVESACSPRASGVSSGYSGFLPQSKDMHDKLIGISKLSVVCDCVSE
ncbi:hypothetical protein QTP86_033169, partial [Hemibagrus guttatus]